MNVTVGLQYKWITCIVTKSLTEQEHGIQYVWDEKVWDNIVKTKGMKNLKNTKMHT
jgi:hypothetical protein